MGTRRFFLLLFTIFLTLITIAFSLFFSIKTTFFKSSMSSVAPEIWSIFILLTVTVVLLMIIQVALKVTEVKGQKIDKQLDTVKIMLELDGMPITMEASNKDRVEEILQLVEDIQARHPSNAREIARDTEHPGSVSSDLVENDEINS